MVPLSMKYHSVSSLSPLGPRTLNAAHSKVRFDSSRSLTSTELFGGSDRTTMAFLAVENKLK